MRRTRAVTTVLATALVVLAATAASATALPVFTGPFPDSFTGTSKATLIESIAKERVKCTADVVKGEVTGPTTAVAQIDFTGCSSPSAPGVPCSSPNGVPGEIQTELLTGQLGYVSREPIEVGLDLMNPTGGPMAVFGCGPAVAGKLYGSVIGKVTPINKKPATTMKLAFAQKAGHQHYTMLLGSPPDFPQMTLGGPLLEAGITSGEVLKFAVATSIVA